MDLDNQTLGVKQEVEIDAFDTIANAAHIKSEEADPSFEIQCDGIKVEELNLKNQDESDSDIPKHDYIWIEAKEEDAWEAKIEKLNQSSDMDSTQFTEESGSKIESGMSANTRDTVVHRIKVEPTEKIWGEVKLAADAVAQVKTEDQLAVEVKSEKLEEKPYMDIIKFENMDTLELNEEVDIKPEGDPSTVLDSDCAAKEKKWGEEIQVDHMEDERDLFICYTCNYKARSKIGLIKHMKVGKCESKTNLDISQFARSSNLYVCTQCDKVFKMKRSLDDHVIKNHSESIALVSSKIHECTQCTYKSTTKNNIIRHMITRHDVGSKYSICVHCNASFHRKQTRDNHIMKEHPEFMASIKSKIHECPLCNFKTTKKDTLNRHMLTHPSAVPKFIICEHCNASFSREQSLGDHILKKHPAFMASVKSKIHECMQCNYKSTRKSHLDEHMLTHADASFSNEQTLDNHMMEEKNPECMASVKSKILECSYCTYKTTIKKYFNLHMLIHSVDNCNTCKHCNKSFSNEQVLDNHIMKNHPDFMASVKSKIHECTQCNFKTIRKTTLNRHMFTHPSAVSKLIRCEHCNASFSREQTLGNHILKNHPAFMASVKSKIHECTQCNYKSTKKSHLNRHILTHPSTI